MRSWMQKLANCKVVCNNYVLLTEIKGILFPGDIWPGSVAIIFGPCHTIITSYLCLHVLFYENIVAEFNSIIITTWLCLCWRLWAVVEGSQDSLLCLLPFLLWLSHRVIVKETSSSSSQSLPSPVLPWVGFQTPVPRIAITTRYKDFSTRRLFFYVKMCLRSLKTDSCSFIPECLLSPCYRRKEMYIADVSKTWGWGIQGQKGFSTNIKTCQMKNMNL